mgnify:CR=1 FL=1
MTEKNSKERARLHTANLARIATVKGAPRETHNMTIKRYECFTGHKHHEATVTDDGPWVSHDDHAEAMQKLWQTADTRERMNSQTIATLRAQVIRRDEEIRDLRHEIESARDAAKGENALRLEAERERDSLRAEVERLKEVAEDANHKLMMRVMGPTSEGDDLPEWNLSLDEAIDAMFVDYDDLSADVERWVKEVAHLKLAAEKAERERDDA